MLRVAWTWVSAWALVQKGSKHKFGFFFAFFFEAPLLSYESSSMMVALNLGSGFFFVLFFMLHHQAILDDESSSMMDVGTRVLFGPKPKLEFCFCVFLFCSIAELLLVSRVIWQVLQGPKSKLGFFLKVPSLNYSLQE
jgi:hypothetical protein